MSFRNIEISDEDILKARKDMFHHPNPLVKRRAMCLVMKSRSYTDEEIAEVVGIDRSTVKTYLDLYEEKGYKGISTVSFYQPKSDLEDYRDIISAEFKTAPPQMIKEARARILTLTGLDRSNERIHKFLRRIGMKLLKTGQTPAKADPVKQKEFLENTLQPLLNKANKGKCKVLFMDSAHFVLSAFVGSLWCFVRVFIQAPSGRFRLNVIGAIDSITKEVISISNTTYITATTVIELMIKISKQYLDEKLYIVLDNARYQHCKAVKEMAADLNIDLVFLPTYSPNLNLIERLWKYVKSSVCSTKYYSDSKSFESAILEFLNNLDTPERKAEMNTRMTLKFQLFPNAGIVA